MHSKYGAQRALYGNIYLYYHFSSLGFCHWDFWHLNLFRISCFGFRILIDERFIPAPSRGPPEASRSAGETLTFPATGVCLFSIIFFFRFIERQLPDRHNRSYSSQTACGRECGCPAVLNPLKEFDSGNRRRRLRRPGIRFGLRAPHP